VSAIRILKVLNFSIRGIRWPTLAFVYKRNCSTRSRESGEIPFWSADGSQPKSKLRRPGNNFAKFFVQATRPVSRRYRKRSKLGRWRWSFQPVLLESCNSPRGKQAFWTWFYKAANYLLALDIPRWSRRCHAFPRRTLSDLATPTGNALRAGEASVCAVNAGLGCPTWIRTRIYACGESSSEASLITFGWRSELLCFQRAALGQLHLRDAKARFGSATMMAVAKRISCVFLCIFLLLHREVHGYTQTRY
jgi:hypothetical protein